MKSPMLLWRELTQELGEWCCVSTSRDLVTASARTEHEGLSFLTITLPNYAKDFEEALAFGKIEHYHFLGFKRNGCLPRFLGGFIAQVFDARTALLLPQANAMAIYAIRQICRFASKILLPCTTERTANAFASYAEVEEELAMASAQISSLDRLEFLRVSRLLFGRVLTGVSNNVSDCTLVPKHGPGSTADRLTGNRKFDQTVWTERLERGGFTSVDFLLPNARFNQNLADVQFLDPGSELPVKVIAVPKTLKTPRIIAIEPTCMQYSQQAVAIDLMSKLESDNLSSRFVGFTDQVPNQELARIGSISGSLATLDLSEASDRVLNSLVLDLTHGYTDLSEAVQACRSTHANVPGIGIIPLTKFASMGSALCFPIEAMVFTTLVFLGIQRAQEKKLTVKTIESFSGQVRVYGDDIIVPVEYAESVMRTLEDFSFRVNKHKSFWSGNFRESCGKDYWEGTDVTTIKCRTQLPSSRRDVKEIVSTVSLRNQLSKAGFVSTVQFLDELLEGILGFFPEVAETSPLLGRVVENPLEGSRLSRDTQSPEKRGWTVNSKPPVSPLEGPGALLKYFLNAGDKPSADEKHLERSGRPLAVNIKLGWSQVQ